MPTLSSDARGAAADAVTNLLDAGAAAPSLNIYTGTAPAGPDTTATGTLLVTVELNDPAFGAAAGGVCTLDVTGGLSGTAGNTGTAGYARLADGNGAGILDLSVSATGGGGEVELATTSIASGVIVEITSGSITMPAS
ncbi:hypothetical protein GCM10010182_67570 [Actinomadura cremea]|nr:hypothetical protein GCM10010182_67570 [Actinomadura cremea]